jgi:Domain of unknown function (DUF4173)
MNSLPNPTVTSHDATSEAPSPFRSAWPPRPSAFANRHRVIAAAASIGIGSDLVLHHGVATLAGTLWATVAAAALWMLAERRAPALYGCLAGVVFPAAVLAWRDAWWLDTLAAGFVVTFLALAAAQARPQQRQLGLRAPFVEGVVAFGSLFCGVTSIGRLVGDDTRQRAWKARGALLMVASVALGLGSLLLGADALAQSYVRNLADGRSVTLHASALVVGLICALGLQWLGHYEPPASTGVSVLDERLRHWAIVTTAAVLAIYATVRVAAALGGTRYLQSQTGMSYAEYARRGFFSLMVVAAIVIVLVHQWGRDSLTTRWCSCVALALTAVVIGCALQGLFLYEQAYGQSMKRWVAISICVALAVALTGLAVTLWRGEWASQVPSLFAAIGVAWFMAISALNPEASLAKANMYDDAPTEAALDIRYLRQLDDDARPTILAWLSFHGSDNQDTVWLRNRLCALERPALGLLNFNWSRARARDAIAQFC